MCLIDSFLITFLRNYKKLDNAHEAKKIPVATRQESSVFEFEIIKVGQDDNFSASAIVFGHTA